MKGTDVAELVKLLVSKNYGDLSNSSQTGSVLFDVVIENAVKKFQRDNLLTADGVVGPKTVIYLQQK